MLLLNSDLVETVETIMLGDVQSRELVRDNGAIASSTLQAICKGTWESWLFSPPVAHRRRV